MDNRFSERELEVLEKVLRQQVLDSCIRETLDKLAEESKQLSKEVEQLPKELRQLAETILTEIRSKSGQQAHVDQAFLNSK